MSQRRIEMVWRCSSCGHKNLGRHKVCQQCQNPKDASEKYEMPDNTSAAPTVTDPALLRMATAGANWRCAYCGSDQRAYDGNCKSCGASSDEGQSTAGVNTQNPQQAQGATFRGQALGPAWTPGGRKPRSRSALIRIVAVIFGAYLFAMVGFTGLYFWKKRPRTVQVASVSWEYVVDVERYQVIDREGFEENRSEHAFDIKPQGQRHHHDEQVLDHYETVYYTEQVQDGYDTESYSDTESCGQDCTYESPTCSESCTSDDNGFATCSTSCSGGGQSCTTRYCTVTKTRQVPRYVSVQRSRQEPRYRAEPRYAEWYTWKVWDWGHHRTLNSSGKNTADPHWPSEGEVKLNQGLSLGEQEREARRERYTVVFSQEGERSFTYEPPSLAEFQRYTLGSDHTIRLQGNAVSVVTE